MPEPIKRFIETFIPGTACNMHCHYCYLGQHGVPTNRRANFEYSRKVMRLAVRKERLGGACFFNFCADGETLLEHRTVEFLRDVLEEGHYAAVVTNGTVSKAFDEICAWPLEIRQRILFIFSFHYLELQRLNRMDTFFDNIRKVRSAGISYFSSMVQCEEYIAHYDEIKALFMKELGILPQVSKYRDDTSPDIRIKTDRPWQEYFDIAIDTFDSNIARFEKATYQQPVTDFCYAGDWMFYLNLCTGDMRACYGQPVFDNLFANPFKPLHFAAVGHHCKKPYCYNGLSRMTMGVVGMPGGGTVDRYWTYRDRVDADGRSTFTEYFKQVTEKRLYETNAEYTPTQKRWCDLHYSVKDKYSEIRSGVRRQAQRFTPQRIGRKLKKMLHGDL